ncbi:MAG: hypothetical protein J3Q66DRAFT_396904 [Benniella sp.]|nr:MAG: hypothetical protein J3Q66DRAFT_396904 [Benniella sp.]
MVLIVCLASPSDVVMGSQQIYTGAQILAVISSWKPEALYIGVENSSWLYPAPQGIDVPSLEEVNKAQTDLEGKPNALGAVFSCYGYVARDNLPHLWRLCTLFDLADRMRSLERWLQDNQAAICNGFMDDLLKSEAKDWKLSSWGLKEAMCLVDEGHLSARVIATLLEEIQMCYKDKVLCIPPHFLTNWDPDRRTDTSNYWEHIMAMRLVSFRKKTTKAFAVVRIHPNHWGLLCVDFTRREFSFGDSMDQGVVRLTEDVKSTICKIVRWLRQAGLMDSPWPSDIARLNVPQQPHDSGSSGVIALNTIECFGDPSIEPWTHLRSAYHRIRYLQVVSGYCNLSRLNEEDREPQRGDRLQSAVLSETGSESQEESSFQSELSEDDGRDPQEGHVYESREAAIEQLRRWAQRSRFRLMIGHTKTGKESKVRLNCSGPKRQRKGPYSSGQPEPRSKKRTDCGFHINIRSNQKIAPAWHITSIVNPHNHTLDVS